MPSAVLYLVFFASGISGLIYQVVWVREFGNAFGNTLHSASIVIAIFMLGLGGGSYAMGRRADIRYARQSPDSVLRLYAWVEGVIAALGLLISLLLPHIGGVVAGVSSYTRGADGWYALTTWSYVARAGLAVLLLTPITVLMGGTLTLLIRYLVRTDVRASGSKIALLYGVNTVGAAAGAFLTDFLLVPAAGLLVTQLVAVGLNLIAAAGALGLAARRSAAVDTPSPQTAARGGDQHASARWTAAALALSGFAVMGMEILWLRHVNILLGGFRAVFSLLMTVVLIGLGAGALLGGWINRRRGRPADTLMIIQALFVVATLGGLALSDARGLAVDPSVVGGLASLPAWQRALTELWFNLRPILIVAAVPSLLAGFAFPLANAIAQDVEQSVGRRAGELYWANTVGAVGGSLVTGYLLLPLLGIQGAAAVLTLAAGAAIVPLHLATRSVGAFRLAVIPAAIALIAWLTLPSGFVVDRALVPQLSSERVLTISEGATELIAVVEAPALGRALLTNGHAMSSTALLDQRYMRALAHLPLLSMAGPSRVLVIGFGVGNSTHAATLHPTVTRVDVADLSRHVLAHAGYFADANRNAIADPKVTVYVNDGRQHLQMTPEGTYDLITLEPPPIAHAGVASLYSREFYALARSRLKPGGYISQWLPAYQVPPESSLAMVRAFIDEFPQAVLLSGTGAELLLLGTTAARIEIEPAAVQARIAAAPAVRADLERFDLATARDIVGTFVGSAATMTRATQASPAITDDTPIQEYGVHSTLSSVTGVPASLFEVSAVSAWCPRCFDGDLMAPEVDGLDLYLALMAQAYTAPPAAQVSGQREPLLGSRYLGATVPDSPEVRNILGVARLRDAAKLLDAGRFAEAEAELRQAVDALPESAEAFNDLGVAVASQGRLPEARQHFARAVALQPDFAEARRNLAAAGGE